MRARNTAEFLSPFVYQRCACAPPARRARCRRRRRGRPGARPAPSRISATAGGGSCVPVSRKCSISRKIHGRPWAARPIMTASAPVYSSTNFAFSGVVDVAVGDHGDAHRLLHRADRVVLGVARVHAGARAPVHGERLDAVILGDARDAQRIAVLLVPAGADLERDRHVHRLHHRIEDPRHQRLVLEQRRPGIDVADLLGRAAHVDVDDLRRPCRRCISPPRPSSPGRHRRSGSPWARPRLRGCRGGWSSPSPRAANWTPPSRRPPCPRPCACTAGGTAGPSRPPWARRSGCS